MSNSLDPAVRRRANKAVAVYGGLRLLLFVALTVAIQALAAAIGAPVPLIMSALLALIVAFPLSMVIFSRQRVAAVEALATWRAQRDERKRWIREELERR
ncbi:DUF4229 domain-containing protein [Corynebacterium liangguodongii]|uniref:DUF4229 domain-containing protein n=1 Tax=Corynebacterium liangguodongii TaxID=2079535 RepID=A0A2S0WC87_9CORY|nr:DUF4229 domain-containing protein [Corynebacterium liangguodongii]AWB83302.1 DUF4229 domain-containing protein [Corynebacterium liangguodongii]PWC00608.1 DUF4229 domain-containing protein [Corynebacterium liangguodongii]